DKSTSYDCPPGEYVFMFRVYAEDGTTLLYQYSDLTIVDSGLCATKTDLAIEDQDFVAKPEKFMAWLVDGSRKSNGSYNVTFTWDPSPSWNATYFELELVELNADGTESATSPKQHFPNSLPGDTDFANRVAGELHAWSNQYTVSLWANHQYEAKIKAKSARGRESDPAERVAPAATDTAPAGCTGGFKVPGVATDTASMHINQLMRTYDLNGGIYNDGTEDHTGTYYEWTTYETGNVDLIDLDKVKKPYGSGELDCQGWIYADGTTVYDGTDPDVAPTGFTAGTYTAKFPSNELIAELRARQDLKVTTVPALDVDNGTCLADTATDVVITITEQDPPRFNAYKIKVTQGPEESLVMLKDFSGNSYTIEKGELPNGSYKVTVIGVGYDGDDYSYPFTLRLDPTNPNP
ncbi:MAG: hypothetical protein K6G18_05045, partial [Treponema sp.]|nr:hypothetical protein [Treponema sp.]